MDEKTGIRAVELVRRIARRGRGFEAGITEGYLAELDTLYEEWIAGFRLAPILVIPGDSLDFVENSGDLAGIVTTVEERLRGEQGLLF